MAFGVVHALGLVTRVWPGVSVPQRVSGQGQRACRAGKVLEKGRGAVGLVLRQWSELAMRHFLVFLGWEVWYFGSTDGPGQVVCGDLYVGACLGWRPMSEIPSVVGS